MLVELAVVQTQNFDVLTSKWWIQNANQHIFRFTYKQNQRIAWFEITPPQLTRAFPTPTLCSIACTFCLRYDLTTQPRATYLYGELDLFARLLGASCFEIRAYTQKQRSVSGSELECRKWNERCICITQFFELGAQRRRLIFQNAKHRVMNWMWLLSYLSLYVSAVRLHANCSLEHSIWEYNMNDADDAFYFPLWTATAFSYISFE